MGISHYIKEIGRGKDGARALQREQACDLFGQLLDGTRRIWAQAEYLRALTLRPDSEALVLQQLRALQQSFLHPAGWTECREADGRPARHDMPSTTPYHLATCYRGLLDYLQ